MAWANLAQPNDCPYESMSLHGLCDFGHSWPYQASAPPLTAPGQDVEVVVFATWDGLFFPRDLRIAYDLTCLYPSEGPMFEGLFQPMHLLVIFAVALLVFGPKKLPELGKGLGEGIRALKDGMKDNPPAQASTDQTKKTETKS